MIYEMRRAGETDEERLADRLATSHVTRQAAERARRERISRRAVDPAAAEALRRLFAGR